jgi:hypothetical protein
MALAFHTIRCFDVLSGTILGNAPIAARHCRNETIVPARKSLILQVVRGALACIFR